MLGRLLDELVRTTLPAEALRVTKRLAAGNEGSSASLDTKVTVGELRLCAVACGMRLLNILMQYGMIQGFSVQARGLHHTHACGKEAGNGGAGAPLICSGPGTTSRPPTRRETRQFQREWTL